MKEDDFYDSNLCKKLKGFYFTKIIGFELKNLNYTIQKQFSSSLKRPFSNV